MQENLERARETGKSVSGRGGYGVLMHLGGGQKRFLGLPDATVWPDAETARFGAMDACDGYGARDKGDEDYEIDEKQRLTSSACVESPRSSSHFASAYS